MVIYAPFLNSESQFGAGITSELSDENHWPFFRDTFCPQFTILSLFDNWEILDMTRDCAKLNGNFDNYRETVLPSNWSVRKLLRHGSGPNVQRQRSPFYN